MRPGSATVVVRRAARADVADVARWVMLGAAAGAWAGAVVGGLGGRAAMFVLRLTSVDGVRGIETDDGFTIGRFSLDTGFLVYVTAVLGR